MITYKGRTGAGFEPVSAASIRFGGGDGNQSRFLMPTLAEIPWASGTSLGLIC